MVPRNCFINTFPNLSQLNSDYHWLWPCEKPHTSSDLSQQFLILLPPIHLRDLFTTPVTFYSSIYLLYSSCQANPGNQLCVLASRNTQEDITRHLGKLIYGSIIIFVSLLENCIKLSWNPVWKILLDFSKWELYIVYYNYIINVI